MYHCTLPRLADVMARCWSRFRIPVLIGLLGTVLLSTVQAQQLTGSITGTTYDQSGAVVPNAKVVLANESSKDTRTSVSNNEGYFSFAAVQPGSYSVTVSAPGFKSWEEAGITVSQGSSLSIPNVKLEVGATSQNVEVVTAAEAVVPTDTGEVATTLNSALVNELPLQGRDAGELIRLMPGMAFANGLTQGSGFTDRVVSSNSGPVGAYSANGTQPNGAMSYMLDGANLVDPGNQGTQIANINGDMTSEIKVLMSGYDAAYAKGPVVFQAFGKSGSSQLHGEAYLYARNNVFNAVDSFQKSQGIKNVDAYEYYPGGQLGGPVLIPWTHFNKNHDKLFFWVGYEYMRQQPSGSLWQTFVPTPDMLGGNFSQASLSQLPGTVSSHYGNITGVPKGYAGGIIPSSAFDPIALNLLKTYPAANVDPSTHNGNNYQFLDQSPQNRWELSEKVDYAVSEKTKLTVSYTYQKETDLHPVQVWWAPAFSLPYPSPLVAPTTSNVVMTNLTHVFSPTLTNETVFTYARYINPVTPVNPSKINPATYGLSTSGLFGAKEVQIPNIISWSGNGGFAGYDQQGVFGGTFNGGAFGGLKSDPAIYDNLSKVAGTHTMKFGFYWDSNGNVQSSGNQLNGTYDFETYGGTTTGNLYADLLTGHASGYSQANAIPVDNLKYHQYSFYAQDSWKATKRLTVNYGGRADHEGQWYPDTKFGAAVFNIGAFEQNPNATNAGLTWHSINSNIPISGYKSPAFYFEPRVGAAYDLFGDGKTVLRGGFAVFRYQIAYNLTSGPSELPEGVINYGSGALTSLNLANITNVPTSSGNAACGNGCSVSALIMGDGKTPYTENYNISLSRALPWQMSGELSYVGNRSRDLLIAGTNSDFFDINMVPMGAFFKADPVTGVVNPINKISNANDYRPFQSYGDTWLSGHGSYANYNSLQASLHKQAGPVVFLANYTYGKVMGIHENYSGNGPSDGNTIDPFNIKNNYGVLAYNHTQIFNTGYYIHLPSPIHGNFLLKGVVNGWQLSGATQVQTGAPIQFNTGGNLNTFYGNTTVNGISGVQPSPTSYLGSNAPGLVLVPQLTCNPGANLKSGQYFNTSCFAPPAPGTNGTLMWPNIHGPAYFDSDLTLSKRFRITEHQSLEFRASAFNFLNHPNPQFGLGGNGDISLNFSQNGNLVNTNQNATTTGTPAHTAGDRLVEFAAKFYF